MAADFQHFAIRQVRTTWYLCALADNLANTQPLGSQPGTSPRGCAGVLQGRGVRLRSLVGVHVATFPQTTAQSSRMNGWRRGAYHRGRVRATRWLNPLCNLIWYSNEWSISHASPAGDGRIKPSDGQTWMPFGSTRTTGCAI